MDGAPEKRTLEGQTPRLNQPAQALGRRQREFIIELNKTYRQATTYGCSQPRSERCEEGFLYLILTLALVDSP
jgi:hypothetical protein